MSDESGQRAQEQPEEQAPKWGDPISPERQAELQQFLDRWAAETDHGKRKGPFDREPGARYGVRLTGADVSWLAEQSGPDEYKRVPNLHLEGADFTGAYLEGANLSRAHLECAYLTRAHLERVYLFGAYLEGADLRGAGFDKASRLNDAILTGVSLDQVSFDQTNLTVVDWSLVTTLGDEQTARTRNDANGKPKDQARPLAEYKRAVRANRLLPVALRNQGMNEDADRFAYRAQLLQQQVLWRQRKFGGYIFSRILDGLVGYGYKPARGLIAYLVIILGFAAAYGLATHGVLTFGLAPSSIQPLQWYETLVLSISSFHGRGFFQPVQSLGDPVAIIAAVEAIIGLLIEISFIATFTQRFFGR